MLDLSPYLALCEPGTRKTIEESKETSIVEHIAPTFFAKLHAKKTELTNLATMAEEVEFPPILINTSSDDFIHVESLKLATALVAAGRDVELCCQESHATFYCKDFHALSCLPGRFVMGDSIGDYVMRVRSAYGICGRMLYVVSLIILIFKLLA